MGRFLKNRKIRASSKLHDPPPTYGVSKVLLTVKLHYGGKFVYEPQLKYENGSFCIVDYVGPIHINVEGITKLCEEVGMIVVKELYLFTEDVGYNLVQNDDELQRLFLSKMSSNCERVLDVYVDCLDKIDVYEDMRESESESEDEKVEECEDDDDIDDNLEPFDDSDCNLGSDTEKGHHVNEEAVDEMLHASFNDHVARDRNNLEPVPTRESDSEVSEYNDESDSGDEDVVHSGDELVSERGSDSDVGDVRYPVFNETNILKPQFELGMKFCSKKILREAINSHAIKTKRTIKITKNDKRRLYAKCMGIKCSWRLNAVKVAEEQGTFRICFYHKDHRCSTNRQVKNLKSSWIARKFIKWFKSDPTRKVKGFRLDVKAKLGLELSMAQAYRAKIYALKLLNGDPTQQYAALWDFTEEVKRTNPGSTVILGIDNDMGRPYFERFYMCLAALKNGFKSGCRPLVGVDGAHLKGPHKGVLLTAVGVDPNNNIYPIAWAVVEKENGDNWAWFLSLLQMDLNINRFQEWTFMSDKQKGLLQAFESIFPGADHRFCVRHLHGNFKRAGFAGTALKDALWKVARATTFNQWECRMYELRALNEEAYRWFGDKPPQHWSKSHFNPHPKCDALLNNGCESFNSCILDARDQPILSMLQWLMQYVMSRHQKNRDMAKEKWKRDWCPKIRDLVEKSVDSHVKDCTPCKSTDDIYSIDCCNGEVWTVNIRKHTCGCRSGCRKWDLTGIPCVHAVSAISAQGLDVWDFINPYYSVRKYLNVYNHVVMPLNGRKEWKKTNYLPTLPPTYGRDVGRPETARRLEPDEPRTKKKRKCRGKPLTTSVSDPQRLKRAQKTVKCGYCGVQGHNTKGCARKKRNIPAGKSGANIGNGMTTTETTQQTVMEMDTPFSSYGTQSSQNNANSSRNASTVPVKKKGVPDTAASPPLVISQSSSSCKEKSRATAPPQVDKSSQSTSAASTKSGPSQNKSFSNQSKPFKAPGSALKGSDPQIAQQVQNASGSSHGSTVQKINNTFNTLVLTVENMGSMGAFGGHVEIGQSPQPRTSLPDVVLTPGPSIAQQIQDASGTKRAKVVQKINNSGNTMLLRVGQTKKKEDKKPPKQPWKI